jgi:naphtho-gamma-pyrone polyketide synthase
VLNHLLPSGSKSTRNVPTIKLTEAPRTLKPQVPKSTQKPTLPLPVAFNTNKWSIANQALAIVADEVGLDVNDLLPMSSFSDFGVDSLLSLNIASRYREELELEVGPSLCVDCPTVKDLLAFLPGGGGTPNFSDASSTPSTPELDSLSAATSTTDETEYSLIDDEVCGDESNVLATIRLTIAEEIGIPVEELTGVLPFSDVGMDSLLSLTVLGKLREILDVELDGRLFQDNNSLDEVEAAAITPHGHAPTRDIIKVGSHPSSYRETPRLPQRRSSSLMDLDPQQATHPSPRFHLTW